MQIIAYQKNHKTTPRKLRLVADVVRDMHPTKALLQLKFMHKLAAKPLSKVMNQAIKNAVNNSGLEEKNLRIKHILIEEAPRFKRWRAASRGRARGYVKRTSHIKVVLENIEPKVITQPTKVEAKSDTKKETKPVIKTKKTVKTNVNPTKKKSITKSKKETKK
jgi:large subunit ribosomal protein L22